MMSDYVLVVAFEAGSSAVVASGSFAVAAAGDSSGIAEMAILASSAKKKT